MNPVLFFARDDFFQKQRSLLILFVSLCFLIFSNGSLAQGFIDSSTNSSINTTPIPPPSSSSDEKVSESIELSNFSNLVGGIAAIFGAVLATIGMVFVTYQLVTRAHCPLKDMNKLNEITGNIKGWLFRSLLRDYGSHLERFIDHLAIRNGASWTGQILVRRRLFCFERRIEVMGVVLTSSSQLQRAYTIQLTSSWKPGWGHRIYPYHTTSVYAHSFAHSIMFGKTALAGFFENMRLTAADVAAQRSTVGSLANVLDLLLSAGHPSWEVEIYRPGLGAVASGIVVRFPKHPRSLMIFETITAEDGVIASYPTAPTTISFAAPTDLAATAAALAPAAAASATAFAPAPVEGRGFFSVPMPPPLLVPGYPYHYGQVPGGVGPP